MRLATTTSVAAWSLRQKNPNYSVEHAIRLCVEAGFHVLDMDFSTHSSEHGELCQPGWEDWAKRIKDLGDENGIECGQAHAHFVNWEKTPLQGWDWHDELVCRSIEAAKIIGAKWIVVHQRTVPDPTWHSHKKSLEANLKAFSRFADCAYRGSLSTRLAIENMTEKQQGRRYGTSVEEILELLDHLQDPVFGVCWDTGHANISGVNQPQAIRELGSNLVALHIHDNNGVQDQHIAPFAGNVPWGEVLQALGEVGYKGDFTFEVVHLTGRLPEELHRSALRFLYDLGNYLISQIPPCETPDTQV